MNGAGICHALLLLQRFHVALLFEFLCGSVGLVTVLFLFVFFLMLSIGGVEAQEEASNRHQCKSD